MPKKKSINNKSPIAYLVYAVVFLIDADNDGEFVEFIYWICESSAISAFDRATEIASTHVQVTKEAIDERRDFLGISEVLPIWEYPLDSDWIGNRVYSKQKKREVIETIMSRTEFIKMISADEF